MHQYEAGDRPASAPWSLDRLPRLWVILLCAAACWVALIVAVIAAVQTWHFIADGLGV